MSRTRILVVDDDLATLDVTRRILRLEGFDVLSADGPRQALEIVSNRPPVHLVLSDVVMPEMQGTQLVREIVRLSPQTADVLMTGYITDTEDAPDDMALLRKPFTRQELICAVSTALAQSAKAVPPIPDENLSCPGCAMRQHIDGLLEQQAIFWPRIVCGEIGISTWLDTRTRHAQMVGRELSFCGLDLAGMGEGAALLPDEIRFTGSPLCQACRSPLERLPELASGEARGRGAAAGEGERRGGGGAAAAAAAGAGGGD